MELLGNWNSMFPQMTWRQTDQSVSTAQIGDLIEFMNPWSGSSLWAVHVGEGRVVHFGAGDENMTQRACRSFIQLMVPKSKGDRVLRKTRICTQHITEIKVPVGTQIRVNNTKHNLVPSDVEMMTNRCETFLHQEFNYDLMNFNSEHFATFVRYGKAVSNQIPFKKKNDANMDTTQTLEMIMMQRMETET
ncbi:phospholipase A and acyltransferase 2-like [Centropristis striata]|uniref:phospholipase A and acyltransferase 2-like n=1 Tax=Centropristis striata TaxID=184440 RepID=UPI0027DF2906|nr:phospholipase A and acyltransferase 2-like [Centropristis striata]